MNKYGIDSAKPPVHIGLIAIQLPAIDLGRATITSTLVYPVNEVRSVLQP